MSLTSTTTTTTTSSGAVVTPVVNSNQLQALAEVCSTVASGTESLMNPMPGPVMNSLVSETKVICNDSIPNPIAPVPVPLPVVAIGDENVPKSITVLSGAIIKVDKVAAVKNGTSTQQRNAEKEIKDENSMNTDNSLSNESSLSPSEPMDCNSTPNISPAHVKCVAITESNEDVAMSETSVRKIFIIFYSLLFIQLFFLFVYYSVRRLAVVCRWNRQRALVKWSLRIKTG